MSTEPASAWQAHEWQLLADFETVSAELAQLARPLWQFGDGYGGQVIEMLNDAFVAAGLPMYEPAEKAPSLRKHIPRTVRQAVFERDQYRCVEPGCGTWLDLTIDHKVAVINGGTNDIDNLQTMCRSHNSSKGARL
jgi:hypothetical protein